MLLNILAITVYTLVSATNGQYLDPLYNMCMRVWHQSVIKNGTLYIDGGIEDFAPIVDNWPNGTSVPPIIIGYNKYLVAVDMKHSWDWQWNISEVALNKTADPSSGAKPPLLVHGALYAGKPDDPNIYLYGGKTAFLNTSFPGYEGPTSANYSLWSYNTQTSDWNRFETNGTWRPSTGAWTEAPELGLAFYFNGELTNGSSTETLSLGPTRVFLEGLIVVDTVHHTLKNFSTASVSGYDPRAKGGLQYVPGIGSMGILVAFGGTYKTINNTDTTEDDNYLEMSTIDVLDVASLFNTSYSGPRWYQQTASGNIPAPRAQFCTVAATAADNSSYNIYVYGGQNVLLYEAFDDLYVLSLPSFTWIKVYGPGQSPRYGHTCHRASPNQIITVGGAPAVGLTGPCDWERKGVAVLNMSSIQWGSIYSIHDTEYTVPSAVSHVIGGGPHGDATILTPASGFSTADLGVLFGQYPPKLSRAGRLAAIIGGTLGGVLVVSVIGGCIVLRKHAPQLLWSKYVNESSSDEKNPQDIQVEEVELRSNNHQAGHPDGETVSEAGSRRG